MAVLKRRTRSVNFRVSEEEYKDLQRVCAASGARSLSDLARSAVNQLIGDNSGTSERTLEDAVRRLDRRVVELSLELQRLARLVERDPPAARPKERGAV